MAMVAITKARGSLHKIKGSGVRVVGPMLACVEGEVHKGRLVLMLSKINDQG